MLRFLIASALAAAIVAPTVWADDTDFLPPPTYYNGATGTGSTLQSQLRTIISSGHILRSYGNFRNSASIHDADPDNPGNILLAYNRASVSGSWDSGSTWNREHVWPQSRQPGSASNSSTGNLGDPHALRPANPQINSDRGNDPFGTPTSSGSHGTVGSYYFPGDDDKGDVARSLFYSATRYTGLTLVNGIPGSNQMGDLESLIKWHFEDVPDTFERRRNQAIYSQGLNPAFYTNNRNPYVDRPEFAWSVFVDNNNDSSITIDGGAASANGASILAVDFGRVYAGEAAPPLTQSVTLNKAGLDGTYYEVTTAGAATSTVEGRYNAFQTGGTDSRTFDVGLNASTASAGVFSGTVTIDNLDVTGGAGLGSGDLDADDIIGLSLSVLNHPVASFAGDSDTRSATLDFGQVALGDAAPSLDFDIFNLLSGGPSFAADLDLDSVTPSGDAAAFSIDLMSFGDLSQGSSEGGMATLMTDNAGDFEATYTFNLSGEDLPGEQMQTLSLTLLAEVVGASQPGDFTGDGRVDNDDLNLLLANWGAPSAPLPTGWDGTAPTGPSIDNDELNPLLANWGVGTSVAVPEPTSLVVVLASLVLRPRRR